MSGTNKGKKGIVSKKAGPVAQKKTPPELLIVADLPITSNVVQ